ncbi:hypothetical protein AB4Y96_09020 [Phyllobacterium sp. TAF24]|uniref:hypothetical protein n=1 Tax=Phyllobacterium sp. TAF24 TaxID=3233068 RepID=UPI003F98F451
MNHFQLTDAQAATLILIEAGKVHQCLFGYGAWRIIGGSPTVVGRLMTMKLTIWIKADPKTYTAQLTDAGRAAFRQHQP